MRKVISDDTNDEGSISRIGELHVLQVRKPWLSKMPRSSSILDISCISRESTYRGVAYCCSTMRSCSSRSVCVEDRILLGPWHMHPKKHNVERLAWQEKMAPNLEPNVKDDVFKRLGDTEGARRATEASRAAASGHGHEPKAMKPKPPPPKSVPAEPASSSSSSSSYTTPTSAPSQKAKFPQKAMPAKAAPKPSRPPPSEKPQQAPQKKKKTNQ